MAALLASISCFFLSFSSAFLFSTSRLLCASNSFLIFISSCCCLRCNDCSMILSFFLSISSMVTGSVLTNSGSIMRAGPFCCAGPFVWCGAGDPLVYLLYVLVHSDPDDELGEVGEEQCMTFGLL
uniref:Secreted protein n=1 Tax=Cacopsylla melanoneura TaxID=428564 RepID=A0A8D8XJ59_9HEMI